MLCVVGVCLPGAACHPERPARGGQVHCTLRWEQPCLPCGSRLWAAAWPGRQAAPTSPHLIHPTRCQPGHCLHLWWSPTTPTTPTTTRRSPSPTTTTTTSTTHRRGSTSTTSSTCRRGRSSTTSAWCGGCPPSSSSHLVQGGPAQSVRRAASPSSARSLPHHSTTPASPTGNAGRRCGEPVRGAVGGGAACQPGRGSATEQGGPSPSSPVTVPLTELTGVAHQHGPQAGAGPGPRKHRHVSRHGTAVTRDARAVSVHAAAAVPRPGQSAVRVILCWRGVGRCSRRPGRRVRHHGLRWPLLQWPWAGLHWHADEELEEAQAVRQLCECSAPVQYSHRYSVCSQYWLISGQHQNAVVTLYQYQYWLISGQHQM